MHVTSTGHEQGPGTTGAPDISTGLITGILLPLSGCSIHPEFFHFAYQAVPRACLATSCVLWSVWVSLRTFRDQRSCAPGVFLVGHGFQMIRLYTITNTTQMIYLQSV